MRRSCHPAVLRAVLLFWFDALTAINPHRWAGANAVELVGVCRSSVEYEMQSPLAPARSPQRWELAHALAIV